jgi:hypothetical protein
MEQQFIYISEVTINEEAIETATSLWKNSTFGTFKHQLFSEESNPQRLLALIALEGLSDVEEAVRLNKQLALAMEPYLASDIHQQVIELVEVVKPSATPLPTSQKLQLRYIEVPLSVRKSYFEWREHTIFDVVRNAPRIESFSAYQTLLSTQPGVLFLSAFGGDSVSYSKDVFETERYKNIVKEAGSRYIAGGVNGLYTRVYARIK